jgi:DNA-binding transcriptional LysR family regulator
MQKLTKPDWVLLKLPSLTATKSFVAAAKYQNFTRAAEALCVTQAAISRQIKELEQHLGVALFERSGRQVILTEAGQNFYDAAYLSFINISQAAKRLRSSHLEDKHITVCCTPAFSSLWLAEKLANFHELHPDIHIDVITSHDFLHLDASVEPDIFINKVNIPKKGFSSIPLFYDCIYPVCSPEYLEKNPQIKNLEGLLESELLSLSPYGRTQIAEHVDWSVWLSLQNISLDEQQKNASSFSANDYYMLVTMALSHQGIILGWEHLVAPLITKGQLVKPLKQEVILKEKMHYLSFANKNEQQECIQRFKDWVLDSVEKEQAAIKFS